MTVENNNPADGDSSAQSAIMNARIEAVKKKYEPRLLALQQEGERLKHDAPDPSKVEAVINVDFDVAWADREIIFGYPEMAVRDKRIVFDVPEVRMDLQRIVFDKPAVRMVPRVVGRKPEFRGPFTIKWTDIIISVPEPYMQRHEIKLDVPQVTMKRKEIVLGIPEFKMKQVKWVVRLPEFRAVKVSAATDKLKDTGKRLSAEAEAIGLAMTAEIQELVTKFMTADGGLGSVIDQARTQFESAINTMKASIESLARQGIDPIKVPIDSGNSNMRKSFEQLVTTRDKVMGELEALVASPAAEEKLAA